MNITGLCTICTKAGMMHTCTLCGALVCKTCYDIPRQACLRCMTRHTPSQELRKNIYF